MWFPPLGKPQDHSVRTDVAIGDKFEANAGGAIWMVHSVYTGLGGEPYVGIVLDADLSATSSQHITLKELRKNYRKIDNDPVKNYADRFGFKYIPSKEDP